jgi:hypothetical protein
MKTIALIGLVTVVSGCSYSSNTPQTLPEHWDMVPNRGTKRLTFIHFVVIQGHQFVLAEGENECAICEVTDASLVRTNLEKP